VMGNLFVTSIILNCKKALKVTSILWCCLLLSSCASLRSCTSCLDISPGTGDHWRHRSFVKIEMNISLVPTSCGLVPVGYTCEEIINTLPVGEMSASGSGLVVKSLSHSTYILTADHVCRMDATEVVAVRTPLGVAQIIMTQNLLLETIDYYGNVRQAEFFSSDSVNDVCLIRTKGTWGNPVPIAESLPAIGETVYNVAAPLGIFNPGMVPMFEGTFSGTDSSQRHFYTLPARPGSSGSAIINASGEVVGVLHSAFRGLEHMAICSSLTAVKELMETIE
jgi:S1-C subfamily serine protease